MAQQVPNPRIAVVGSGAVGCYYGGMLAASGRDVHFLMRADLDHVRRRGLRIESDRAPVVHLAGVQAYGDTRDIGPCDLVIVALKATENHHLDRLLPPLLAPETAVITLQNGLGNEDYLAERFGPERVMGGLCFVCLNRTGPGVIRHIAEGRIAIGEIAGWPLPRTHDLALMMKHAGVPCVVVESLRRERWKKLVWNVPFNGLAIAAGGIDTAAILADDSLAYLARALMREVIGIARLRGYELPASLVEDQVELTRGMGAYLPSSVIDFLAGGRVEVEAIWGEVVRRGFNVGAEVGRIDALYRLIDAAVARRTGQQSQARH